MVSGSLLDTTDFVPPLIDSSWMATQGCLKSERLAAHSSTRAFSWRFLCPDFLAGVEKEVGAAYFGEDVDEDGKPFSMSMTLRGSYDDIAQGGVELSEWLHASQTFGTDAVSRQCEALGETPIATERLAYR